MAIHEVIHIPTDEVMRVPTNEVIGGVTCIPTIQLDPDEQRAWLGAINMGRENTFAHLGQVVHKQPRDVGDELFGNLAIRLAAELEYEVEKRGLAEDALKVITVKRQAGRVATLSLLVAGIGSRADRPYAGARLLDAVYGHAVYGLNQRLLRGVGVTDAPICQFAWPRSIRIGSEKDPIL